MPSNCYIPLKTIHNVTAVTLTDNKINDRSKDWHSKNMDINTYKLLYTINENDEIKAIAATKDISHSGVPYEAGHMGS